MTAGVHRGDDLLGQEVRPGWFASRWDAMWLPFRVVITLALVSAVVVGLTGNWWVAVALAWICYLAADREYWTKRARDAEKHGGHSPPEEPRR